MNEANNTPDWVKRSYGALIDTTGYIVERTSDQGAEIAIRALPLVAPLPNAIAMYAMSQDVLGYSAWGALWFAASLELALFGVAEVVLYMFSGYEKDERRYKYPLTASVIVMSIVMAIVMILVYRIEVVAGGGKAVLALLPLFSAASAAMLALKRWHVRNQLSLAEDKRVSELGQLEDKILTVLSNNQSIVSTALSQMSTRLDGIESDIETVRSAQKVENSQTELNRESVTNSLPILPMPQAPAKATKTDKELRQAKILSQLKKVETPADIDFGFLAAKLGTSDKTIRRDIKELEAAGRVTLNGVVTVHTK